MTRRNPARAGIAPVITLVLLALIPAALLAYGWRWADARVPRASADTVATEPPTPPSLATPLLSMRRAPQTMATTKSEEALAGGLGAFAANAIGANSCLTVSLDGKIIFDQNGDIPITPASNQKLETAAAALTMLGPDSVFTTSLKGNVVDGVVQGDLYLVGGGDPLLSTADYPPTQEYPPVNVTPLETLADNLVAAGVTQITGHLVADESRYDAQRFVDSWDSSIRNKEAGPLSALMVNDATRTLGSVQRYKDPAVGAAQQLAKLLQARNINVSAGPSVGVAPADAPTVASINSAPLSAIVQEMLTTSDDNTAEMLLKEMGFKSGGGGSTASGAAAMAATLQQLGVDSSQLNIVDGSGLSSADVSRCDVLLQLIGMQQLDGPIGTGLPVAAQTGTLTHEFVSSPMAGRLHAKTGSLSGVKSLSGYLPTPAGTIEFSMILNQPGIDAQGAYQAPWDQLGQALATFPTGPTVDQLQPK